MVPVNELRLREKNAAKARKTRSRNDDSDTDKKKSTNQKPFNFQKLKLKEGKYFDGEGVNLFNEFTGEVTELKVVARKDKLIDHSLPQAKDQPQNESRSVVKEA